MPSAGRQWGVAPNCRANLLSGGVDLGRVAVAADNMLFVYGLHLRDSGSEPVKVALAQINSTVGDLVGTAVAVSVAVCTGVGVGSDPPLFTAIAPAITEPTTATAAMAATTSQGTAPPPLVDGAGATGGGRSWGGTGS